MPETFDSRRGTAVEDVTAYSPRMEVVVVDEDPHSSLAARALTAYAQEVRKRPD